MSLPRLVTAASTIVVAIVLALGVPFAQLRTVGTRVECCCPDPARCKCPDHERDDAPQPVMRVCHKTQHDAVVQHLSAFVSPPTALALAPERPAIAVSHAFKSPRPEPAPRRPDVPS